MANKKKFVFPNRGFHLVTDKVAETDFFLEHLRNASGFNREFQHYFSAFVSAARSITFCLQSVMHDYPRFQDWYAPQRESLKNSSLAKFFVMLRNETQKVGPISFDILGLSLNHEPPDHVEISPLVSRLDSSPQGDIRNHCTDYFIELLSVIGKCYRDFDVYVDPRVLFTERGIDALGWAVEDVEVALGFPEGWTKIPGYDQDKERLQALSSYGGDEELEYYLDKYNLND